MKNFTAATALFLVSWQLSANSTVGISFSQSPLEEAVYSRKTNRDTLVINEYSMTKNLLNAGMFSSITIRNIRGSGVCQLMGKLCEVLQRTDTLRELHIRNSSAHEIMMHLSLILHVSPKVESLEIDDDTITTEDAKQMVCYASQHPGINNLAIKSRNIDADVASDLEEKFLKIKPGAKVSITGGIASKTIAETTDIRTDSALSKKAEGVKRPSTRVIIPRKNRRFGSEEYLPSSPLIQGITVP